MTFIRLYVLFDDHSIPIDIQHDANIFELRRKIEEIGGSIPMITFNNMWLIDESTLVEVGIINNSVIRVLSSIQISYFRSE
jgi:hypothetical protein